MKKTNLLGDRNEFSLSARGLHAVAIVFIATSFMAFIQFLFLGYYANAYSQLPVAAMFLFIYYLSRFQKKFSLTRILTGLVFFTGYPFFWYLTRDSIISPLLILVALVILTSILWQKKGALIISAMLFIETLLLVFIHNAGFIRLENLTNHPLSSKTFFEVFIVAFSLLYLLTKMMEDYNYEKNRAEDQALELKAVNERLESVNRHLAHLTTIDGLTCLFNRRHFDEYLYNELCRSLRNGTVLTLAMLDLDNFKTYNDLYGHTTGDDILRTVSDVLIAAIKRNSDMVARYGGEEFAVVMPETSVEGAMVLMEEITALIAREPDLGKYIHPVTLSIGLATGNGVECNIETLINQADTALYEAKHSGKNCIRVYTAK